MYYAHEEQQIIKKVRQITYQRTLELLEKTALAALRDAMQDDKRYQDVTGNSLTSTVIGIYHKGRLVKAFQASDTAEDPTMKTLRKGQWYPLTEYYDGTEAWFDEEGNPIKPFAGKEGKGGQWGPTLGNLYIHRLHTKVKNTWSIVVAIPVSYAQSNERIVATMQGVFDDIGYHVREFATARGNLSEGRVNLKEDGPVLGGLFD